MRLLKLLSGPVIFFLILLLPLGDIPHSARYTLAITLWMACWWVFEAIPLAVTALLPIILFPLTETVAIKITVQSYASPVIYLFLGGFMMALAVEKWNLHKRIALAIIELVGVSSRKIIFGFMLATALLSMWISNTATALMLLPIGLALYQEIRTYFEDEQEGKVFGKVMMFAIAYSASIGGTATLIGTPTNLIFTNAANQLAYEEVSFSSWLLFALPIAAIMILICYFYLTRILFNIKNISAQGVSDKIAQHKEELGKITYEEKCVFIVFTLTSFFWITRTFIWQDLIPGISDAVIALVGATVLFAVPAKSEKSQLLDWPAMKNLPWDILLLFGGGLAIATGFTETGLASWLGSQFDHLGGTSVLIILLILIASINFLTEITSNVATAAIFMPVMIALSVSLELHPYLLMAAVSMTASYAFMLPVATPPNAVIFGSGLISIIEMAKAGFGMNIISIIILTLAHYFFLPWVWGL